MIGARISSILILIKLAAALNTDGFCSFVETYTERVTTFKTFLVTIPFSKRCGIFSTRTCYEYRDQTRYERVAKNVLKTRKANRCCEGYILENSKCIPVCSVPCTNGLCTEPDVCTCSSGYVKSGEKSKCIPKCSDGCLNGNCESPEKCVCNPGYEIFNSSVCNPICQDDCLFGTCIGPDKCSCLPGYQLQADSNHICNPVCSSDCSHGNCVKPDLCVCNDEYEFNEESKECEPVCNEECVNSNCTSPNICTCEIGFYPSNATHCQILCENCTNGYCEEPNVCQCDIGYHIEEGMCVVNECTSNLMEDSCENGYCSDGMCECNSGYEKNATKACSPICSLECVNGYCSEPETCQCHFGYDLNSLNVTDDGNCTNCTTFSEWNVCVPICADCQNGTCTESMCNCSDGYVPLTNSLMKCIDTSELEDIQSNNHGVMMMILGIVLIIVAGGLTYWGYVIWSQQTVVPSVAGVVYKKGEDISVL